MIQTCLLNHGDHNKHNTDMCHHLKVLTDDQEIEELAFVHDFGLLSLLTIWERDLLSSCMSAIVHQEVSESWSIQTRGYSG